jgi:DNA-binding NarL/FixJ family response regulator
MPDIVASVRSAIETKLIFKVKYEPAISAGIKKSRILLVDDHPIFRQGLEDLLKKQHDLFICAHADSASAALTALDRFNPDLAIVDLSLNGTNGLELIKQMKARAPYLVVLVLSVHDDSANVLHAFKAGAFGYVVKGDSPQTVIDSVRRIMRGERFLSPRFQETTLSKLISGSAAFNLLSSRELQVLTLLGKGDSTESIARRLNLSRKTVETHRSHIREKLKLADSVELLTLAKEWVTYQEPA